MLVLHNTYYDYHYLVIHVGLHVQIPWNSWKILHWNGRHLSTIVTMVLWVTVGHIRVTIGHIRVTIGHSRVTMSHLRLTIGYL